MWQRYSHENTQNHGSQIPRQQPSAFQIRGELPRSGKAETEVFRNRRSSQIRGRVQERRAETQRNRTRGVSGGAPRHGARMREQTERVQKGWLGFSAAHDQRRDRLFDRSEEHTSELQSRENLVCRLLLE